MYINTIQNSEHLEDILFVNILNRKWGINAFLTSIVSSSEVTLVVL